MLLHPKYLGELPRGEMVTLRRSKLADNNLSGEGWVGTMHTPNVTHREGNSLTSVVFLPRK